MQIFAPLNRTDVVGELSCFDLDDVVCAVEEIASIGLHDPQAQVGRQWPGYLRRPRASQMTNAQMSVDLPTKAILS